MQNSGHKIREAIEKVWDNFVETKAMLNKRSLWVRKWNKKNTKKCKDRDYIVTLNENHWIKPIYLLNEPGYCLLFTI